VVVAMLTHHHLLDDLLDRHPVGTGHRWRVLSSGAEPYRPPTKAYSSLPSEVETGLPEWCSAVIAPQLAAARNSPSSESTWTSVRRSRSVGGGMLRRRISPKYGERGG